jgi:hypothetical protein
MQKTRSRKSRASVPLRIKTEDATEKLKNPISGSSPNYDLFNHANYGQTQTGATVPFRPGNGQIDNPWENCFKS